jgi:hypothetical protein
MTRMNALPPGLLMLSALVACATIVTSACGAAFPAGIAAPMTSDNPAALTGGVASEYYSAVSAGIPAVANPEGGPQMTSDVITDQELVDLVRSLNYPGIEKSVRVVTNQSDTGNTLDIQASSEDGVLITRSPFTTRIHIRLLRESTARNSADLLAGIEPINSLFALPAETISTSNRYIAPFQTGLSDPDDYLFDGLNLRIDPFDMPGSLWPPGGFTSPASQVSLLIPQVRSDAILPSVSTLLDPFNPSVRVGGLAGGQFGSGPGSAIAFHESQSATGVINSFSYQTDFSSW